MLNVFIGAWFDESISTPGRAIELHAVQFRSTPTNDECQLPNRKCVLQNCTDFTSIAVPGVEIDSSNQAPTIMFRSYFCIQISGDFFAYYDYMM